MGRNKNRGKNPKQTFSLSQVPDDAILIEAYNRRGESLNEIIKPSSYSPRKVSLEEWKRADAALQNVDFRNRNPMLRIYDNIDIDLDLTSVTDTRSLKVQQAKFNIVGDDGKPNEDAKKKFVKQWFRDFVQNAMKLVTEGYQLLETIKFNDEGELTACDLVSKFHLIPEKGICVTEEGDETGIDYLNGNQSLYYIPVGKPKEMGLFRKIAPIILAKKYAIGQWGGFNEKLGIPFRTVHTKSNDKERQRQLGVIMEQMGSAGWAVLSEDEKVELLEISGTNPTLCFETFINMLNAQIAMALNGQSSTADSSKQKGTYGSLKILNEISKDRHESDLTFIGDLVNNILIPRLTILSSFYSDLKGLKLEWDYSEQLSVKEIVEVVTELVGTGKYIIKGETITKKIGIEVLDAAEPPKEKTPTAASKKKSLNLNISTHYKACCNHAVANITAASIPNFEADLLRIAKTIFDNKQNGVVDIPLMKKTASYLREGMISGFGKSFDDPKSLRLKKN